MENQSISTVKPNIFLQPHSAVIRIWHWITFLFITASIITVLLASTLLNPRENIGMIKEQLQKNGLTVTNDQAFAVSHEYEDKVWGVHKLIGIGIAFLILSRLVIEWVQPGEEKFRSRLKNGIRLFKMNDEKKPTYRHYISVKITYMLFYALLLCMVLTGLSLAFGRDLGFSRGLHESVKQIHSIGQYCMYTFILVHVGGVIIADNTEAKGLVSGMLNGGKDEAK